MSIEQMRAAVTKVYPGDKWKKKVSKMNNVQVIALYYKFLENGKLK